MPWFYFVIRYFQRNIYIYVNLRCLIIIIVIRLLLFNNLVINTTNYIVILNLY